MKTKSSNQIYKSLCEQVPQGLLLNKEEKLALRNIAELWDTNPSVARELEKCVFSLIQRLNAAKL